MRRLFIYSTALVLQFFLCAKADEIKVVTEYLPPFQQQGSDGTLEGYAIEVVNELFKITEDSVSIEVLPWARAYNIALTQKNVLIFSIARTKEREPIFNWIGALRYERFFFWGLTSNFSKPINSLTELKNLSVASSLEYNSTHYLVENDFKNIHTVTKDNQHINMLYSRRADLILGNELIIHSLVKSMALDTKRLQKVYEASSLNSPLSLAFGPNTDPKLINKYRNAFNNLISSGKLSKIKEKWSIVDDKKIGR